MILLLAKNSWIERTMVELGIERGVIIIIVVVDIKRSDARGAAMRRCTQIQRCHPKSRDMSGAIAVIMMEIIVILEESHANVDAALVGMKMPAAIATATAAMTAITTAVWPKAAGVRHPRGVVVKRIAKRMSAAIATTETTRAVAKAEIITIARRPQQGAEVRHPRGVLVERIAEGRLVIEHHHPKGG